MLGALLTKVKGMLGIAKKPDKNGTPPYDAPKKYVQRVPRALRLLGKDKP